MHLKTNINIMDFLMEIKNCKDNVYFETPDGDSLVLSSVLSQYIFCSIADQPYLRETGVVRFINPADQKLLSKYLCN